MKYNGVVQRKLALLNTQVLRLEESLKDVSFSEFEESWILRSMAERALQVAAEIIIDVAERILALEKSGPAATAAEAIESLVSLGVLESSQPYADITRFRNLIVHQYEEIDPVILFDLSKKRLDDFRKFRDEIDALE
ncbi:MAG: DUF86 domain-containing protein [Kiritimatiellales bacterium]|nr:DUF86 domain-containing protein [Kiritimatiellota bacterium]MBL7016167.1 DUF86 domain-containing protein [Kiritimatiellales bacterium]